LAGNIGALIVSGGKVTKVGRNLVDFTMALVGPKNRKQIYLLRNKGTIFILEAPIGNRLIKTNVIFSDLIESIQA
jgi:hypothetical protein